MGETHSTHGKDEKCYIILFGKSGKYEGKGPGDTCTYLVEPVLGPLVGYSVKENIHCVFLPV
jgi:hypothetical protein